MKKQKKHWSKSLGALIFQTGTWRSREQCQRPYPSYNAAVIGHFPFWETPA
jgi:hypothetical protein